jgi:hypothetical protein
MPRRLTPAELLRRLDIIAERRAIARERLLETPLTPDRTDALLDEPPPPERD